MWDSEASRRLFWLLTMPKKRTRKLPGTLAALVIMLAGGVLIYSAWQACTPMPGRTASCSRSGGGRRARAPRRRPA